MPDPVHIVCTECNAINRIATARLADQPVCGKCRAALFQGQPAELSESAFRRHIGKSELPVLVDFWAQWCGPCRAMAPAYAEACRLLEPSVRVVKVDTERAQASAAKLNIRSIPTLVLFKDGNEVARQAGAMGTADIVRWTNAHL